MMFFILFSNNNKEIVMLEKNLLYRRMQNRDIFRTLARTYSRQHQQRSQRTHNHSLANNPLLDTQHNRSESQKVIDIGRTFTANEGSRKDFNNGRTAPLHTKTEQTSYPFSQTMKLNTCNSHFSREQSNEKSSCLLSLGRKRDSDSLLVGVYGRSKREQFKLKSCVKREHQHYEGSQDETQFSLLELEKQRTMKRGWTGGSTAGSSGSGLFRINPNAERRLHMGKKVAAHAFSKYAWVGSSEKSNTMGTESQLN